MAALFFLEDTPACCLFSAAFLAFSVAFSCAFSAFSASLFAFSAAFLALSSAFRFCSSSRSFFFFSHSIFLFSFSSFSCCFFLSFAANCSRQSLLVSTRAPPCFEVEDLDGVTVGRGGKNCEITFCLPED